VVTETSIPPFPAGNEKQRERFFHHIEWCPGWEYKATSGERPEGFELNVDRGVGYDEALAGWTKVSPGVLRNPNWLGSGGPVLVTYWRRKL
jgi:hypothetical protein